MRTRGLAVAALAVAALGGDAGAGGLSRVNNISPRAVALGGAFAGVADDPSALHFNPAGLTGIFDPLLAIGLEYINAERTYTPVDEEGNRKEPQSPTSRHVVLPSVGMVFRPFADGLPSRFAFGVGLWNTYGGQLTYAAREDPLEPALNETREAVFELVTGVGYEASEYLSVGLSLRLGLGLFDVDATSRPVTSQMSGSGLGVGLIGGVMLSNGVPAERAGSARVGITYRTPMTVTTSGTATLDLTGGPTDLEFDHDQQWPQSAALGVAWRPAARLLLAAEADWTDWSRINEIAVTFPGQPDLNQHFEQDWEANYSLHLGTEVALSRAVSLMGGGAYDTRAVPLRTMERHSFDYDKFTADAGVAVAVSSKLKLLAAGDVILGPGVDIPNNTAEAREAGWIERANKAPGTHRGRLITVELAAHYTF
jgi:long-chain fatty acid transport protein